MTTYTPPTYSGIDFIFSSNYSIPSYNQVNFIFGIIATVSATISRDNLYSTTGFNSFSLNWTSTASGTYRVELGGTGANTGSLLATGYCIPSVLNENIINDSQITTASGYTGYGTYRINIYVLSSDNIWTLYS